MISSQRAKDLWMNQTFREKVALGHRKNPSPTTFGKEEHHWNWSSKPSYQAVHKWLRRNFGKAQFCENKLCQHTNPKRFSWANVSKKYLRDRADYIQLCMSCHIKWDRGIIKIDYVKIN